MTAHTLPSFPTPFIGRTDELAALTRLMNNPDCRLLTLVGPGGIGKTRLAVAFAAQHEGDYADGVCFVPLQAACSQDEIITTLSQSICHPLLSRGSLKAELFACLNPKNVLLILDNMEHLVTEGQIISELLAATTRLKLLVTSRERLNLFEERTFEVRGLRYPAGIDEYLADEAKYSAVELFGQRAHWTRPEFQLADELLPVIQICQLIEGMPLAVEMAATWTRALTCGDIASEIEHNLDILHLPATNAPPRHRTMRAVLDHSWVLLSEAQRNSLARLSVFRGGFTREAAQAVARASLHDLLALLDKSWLRWQGHTQRYEIHELLRQYAAQMLEKDATQARQVSDAHARYYMDYLKSCEAGLHSDQQHEIIRLLELDLDNIRAAWHRVIDEADLDAIQQGAHAYYDLNDISGRYHEAASAMAAAINMLQAAPASAQRDFTLAIGQNAAGGILIRLGRFKEAREAFTSSIRLFQQAGRPPAAGFGTVPFIGLGLLATTTGNYAGAVAHIEAALTRIDPQDDKLNLGFALYVLANATYALGQFEKADDYAHQAYEISDKHGDFWFGSYILIVRGNIARATNNDAQALAYYQASYTLKAAFNDLDGMAFALNCMARIALLRGSYEEAARLYRQSHDLYHEVNDPGGIATAVFGLGDAAQAAGDYAAGRRHFAQALNMAIDLHWSPLILDIITGTGEIALKSGDVEQAAHMLAYVIHHPAAESFTFRRASDLLAQAKLPTASLPGEAVDLDRMARSTVEYLQQTVNDRTPYQPHLNTLTPREREVLALIAAGLTNHEIAGELVVGVSTVKKHITHIYSKLDANDRVNAINRARALGLLPPSP